MRIDNNLTADKTAFNANILAKISCKELDGLLPEFQKMAREIPGTEADTILLTEQLIREDDSEGIHAVFDFFQQGNPKSVLSEGEQIGYDNGRKVFYSDYAQRLRRMLQSLADRIKELPKQYQDS